MAEGTVSKVSGSRSARLCGCGTRLASDNLGTLCVKRCGPCQRKPPDPPRVPPEFWQTDRMREALASQDVGCICAAYRQHPFHGPLALTQKLVAGWLGIDQAYLSRIESGQRRLRDLDMLIHWARTLSIPPQYLWFDLPGQTRTSQRQPGDGETNGLGTAVPAIRHVLLRRGEIPGDDGAELPTLAILRRQLNWAYRLRQASRYTALGHALPRLLTQVQRLTLAHAGDDRLAAYGLLAGVNHLTAGFLKKAGERELAWVAIDRSFAVAELAEAPLVSAACAYRLSNLLLAAGHLTEARDITANALDRLDPELGTALDANEHLSMWGALCLKSAVIAARRNDRAAARRFLTEAKAAADRIGEDRNDFWTAFGPTNVAIHEVSVAVELGDAGQALRRAGAVDLSRLPVGLLERRAHFLIDVARGHAQRRQDTTAVGACFRPSEPRLRRCAATGWLVAFSANCSDASGRPGPHSCGRSPLGRASGSQPAT